MLFWTLCLFSPYNEALVNFAPYSQNFMELWAVKITLLASEGGVTFDFPSKLPKVLHCWCGDECGTFSPVHAVWTYKPCRSTWNLTATPPPFVPTTKMLLFQSQLKLLLVPFHRLFLVLWNWVVSYAFMPGGSMHCIISSSHANLSMGSEVLISKEKVFKEICNYCANGGPNKIRAP